MLYTDRIKNLVAAYPRLTRVWIETGDVRRPLKGVWMDESKLDLAMSHECTSDDESPAAELAEDHLALAA